MNSKRKNLSDTTILLTITIVVFFAMYIGAMIFQGKGFLKPQTFFNILNFNNSFHLFPFLIYSGGEQMLVAAFQFNHQLFLLN